METSRDLVWSWEQEMAQDSAKRGTAKKYRQAVVFFLNWHEQEQGRPLGLSDLVPVTFIAYRNDLQHRGKNKVSTINLRMSALRAWCKWLAESGHIPSDPSPGVRFVSGKDASKRDGLTGPQVHALLRQSQDSHDPERNYAVIQTMLQTGIRLTECTVITYGDIAFGERSGELLIRAGKGNKVRTVPLNGSARDAIAHYVWSRLGASDCSMRAVAHVWPKSGSAQSLMLLWSSQRDGMLTSSGIGQMIAELVKKSGIPEEISAHHLRHTFAHSYLREHPGDIAGLAEILGHSSLETTRIYSKPTLSELSARVEKISLNAYT
jgi:site-specific recombinase XerD